MTLGDLKTQFKAMLNNTVVANNASLVSTFINQSIMRIQRELRVPFQEKQVAYTIPTGFTKLPIPSDLLELIALMVDRDNDSIQEYELRRTDLTRVTTATELPLGYPDVYARQGGSWIIGPNPVAGSVVLVYYYAEFPALVLDTDTNTLLGIAWDAVLYGALSAACDYLRDERLQGYEQRYTQITKSLQEQADADELTGDTQISPCLPIDDECDW